MRFEDGTEAYIAPNTLARDSDSGHRYFLAGTPNYVFGRDSSGQGILLGRDSILGAIISERGSHAVDSPLGLHLVALVRAVGRTDGGWDVVFGERDRPALDAPNVPTGRVVRLWYGVYKDRRWHSLEQIPLPEGSAVVSMSETAASELVTSGDRLAWAVGVSVAGATSNQVAILERINNRWGAEIVETDTGIYLSLSYSDSSTLLLAAVKPDESSLRPGEPGDSNSLFVWVRAGTWSEPRRIVLGREGGRAHRPLLTTTGAVTTLTWARQVEKGFELRAVPDVLNPDSALTIAPTLANTRAFSVLPSADGPIWVSLDARPSERIRILQLTPGGHLQLSTTAQNPFFATFRAAGGVHARQAVLVGGIGVPDRNIVLTVITAIQLGCTEATARRSTPDSPPH